MSTDRPPLPPELTKTGVVAIARAADTRRIRAAVETLVGAGVTCVELTLTMPDAVPTIASLVDDLGSTACIGAGTVLTAAEARQCIDAGAKFLVAPSTVPEVVAVCLEAGVPCFPGALTPSEIVSAWLSGAAAVKLFPASLGGAQYIRDVRAPLPNIPLIPTGGVRIDDVPAFLAAGAVAVGLGGPLFGTALSAPDAGTALSELADRAKRVLDAVRISREGRPV